MPSPYAPAPPEVAKRVSLWGVPNGLWRLTFLGVYFALVAVSLKGFVGLPAPGPQTLIVMHLLWAVFAAHMATMVNRDICGLVNEAREEDYAKARAKAELAMPVDAYKHDPETGDFVPQRRALLDPRIGVSERR